MASLLRLGPDPWLCCEMALLYAYLSLRPGHSAQLGQHVPFHPHGVLGAVLPCALYCLTTTLPWHLTVAQPDMFTGEDLCCCPHASWLPPRVSGESMEGTEGLVIGGALGPQHSPDEAGSLSSFSQG